MAANFTTPIRIGLNNAGTGILVHSTDGTPITTVARFTFVPQKLATDRIKLNDQLGDYHYTQLQDLNGVSYGSDFLTVWQAISSFMGFRREGSVAPTPLILGLNGRNFNQAYQPNLIGHTMVTASCIVDPNNGSGMVELQLSADGTTNWQTLAKGVVNTMLGSDGSTDYTITNQQANINLVGIIPTGWYYRLQTTNTTGSPIYSYACGVEYTY